MKKGYTQKTQLTPLEKIQAAYLHYFLGVDSQTLTAIYAGVNSARIGEALNDVRAAVGLTREKDEQAA